jgi:hypothetical protein
VASSATPSGNAVSFDGTTITYTPGAFTGADQFTYVVFDGTDAVQGTVTITVDATTTSVDYYLQSGPALSNQWSLSTTPPVGSFVADYDLDLAPGLTIVKSDGKYTISDGRKYQDWAVTPAAPLQLNGPVTLELWSSVENFQHKDAHLHAYLDVCDSDGTNCTTIRTADVHVNHWNQGAATWTMRTFSLGTVNTTVSTTQMVRLRLLFGHEDIWVAMNGSYPTKLVLPVGP